MSDIIASDAQELSPESALIELYEVEITFEDTTVQTIYITPEYGDGSGGSVSFNGNTYEPFPMELTDVEWTSDGAQNRPKAVLANVISLRRNTLFGVGFKYEDLIGAKITKRTTLAKYLLQGYEFPKKVYIIDRITSRNPLTIEVELASPFDLQNVRIPNRVVTGKYCPWNYQEKAENPNSIRSACFWKKEQQSIGPDDNLYSFFFTKDDEPIIHETLVQGTGSATAGSFWAGQYSSTSTYYQGQVIAYGSYYWQLQIESTNNNAPNPTSKAIWKKVRLFSEWDINNPRAYTISSTGIYEDNSYVYYAGTIWRCLKAHTTSIDVEPGTNGRFWTRGDVCGKILSSCKCRYGARLFSSDTTGILTKPSSAIDNKTVLPFGGFPGSNKYR